MRRVLVSSVVGLLILTPLAGAQDDPSNKDLQMLQGKWIQVSVEGEGNKLESAKDGPSVIIDGERWLELSSAGDSITSFSIHARREPKQLDRIFSATTTFPGIYKLEEDTFTVAIPIMFNGKVELKRPATFATKPGDWFAVIVYKRVADDSVAELLQPAQWGADWKTAFESARTERRLVFVDFFAAWCKPCQEMEDTVFRLPDVKKRLGDFVLLRVDVDRGKTAWAQKVNVFPTYSIYDPQERERFRFVGAASPARFRQSLDAARSASRPFLDASDLLDAKKDVEAQFLVGNTYSRLGINGRARETYKEARKTAEVRGDKANAQLADALSAFTFAREGHPAHAIKLLKKLAESPASRENKALIWLTLGNAYQLAKDPKAAVDAYQHAQSAAVPGSRTYQDASAAIARVQ